MDAVVFNVQTTYAWLLYTARVSAAMPVLESCIHSYSQKLQPRHQLLKVSAIFALRPAASPGIQATGDLYFVSETGKA